MSEQTTMEPELSSLRERIQNGEKLFVKLHDNPTHSIDKEWYSPSGDARFHNKVLQITSCHYSVKEAMQVKLFKGKQGKHLHYKDLTLLTPEQVEEMTSTVFHFNPESL